MDSVKIRLPDQVQTILSTLEAGGYEAYAVGGCVRDSLLGKEPGDWDICTSALPAQAKRCFEGHSVMETGIRHGTITLVLNHKPFEITTYRADGAYSDNRHPDEVKFVNSLKEDVSRRDFTVGAMAYHPKEGLIDFFGGREDLRRGVIRCVRNADKRLQEDALRILRALRFASVLGFSIDGDTARAISEHKGLLKTIAAERVAAELNKLIVGDGAGRVISEHIQVIAEVLPELLPSLGFDQNNKHHCYDVLTHILVSVGHAPKDTLIRLALLFHDIAKPACYTEKDGVGHTYGHPKVGSEMAKNILRRLRYDNDTIDTVAQLILYHDTNIQPTDRQVKRWLNALGETRLRQLIEVKRADTQAKAPQYIQAKLEELDKVLALTDEIIRQRQCFSLKTLAVNGKDIMALGMPEGPGVGGVLNRLLNMVVDGDVENVREALLAAAKDLCEISFRV